MNDIQDIGKCIRGCGGIKVTIFVKNKMALSSILQIERVRERRLPVYYRPFQALPAFVQEKPSFPWPGLSAISMIWHCYSWPKLA